MELYLYTRMYAYSCNNRAHDIVFRFYKLTLPTCLKDMCYVYLMKPLAISGSLFSISGLVAYYYANYITAYLSFLLSFTSIWYHSYSSKLSYNADKIALYSVVLRSLFDGYNGSIPGMVLFSTINSYNYFVFFSSYSQYCCWHPVTGGRWHMTIHFLAVLGIILQQPCIKV